MGCHQVQNMHHNSNRNVQPPSIKFLFVKFCRMAFCFVLIFPSSKSAPGVMISQLYFEVSLGSSLLVMTTWKCSTLLLFLITFSSLTRTYLFLGIITFGILQLVSFLTSIPMSSSVMTTYSLASVSTSSSLKVNYLSLPDLSTRGFFFYPLDLFL